jgi:tetratricopeptide (TPR) repeat protein
MNTRDSRSRRTRLLTLALIVGLAPWGTAALSQQPSDPAQASREAPPARNLLDAIREDLVNLRFESALAAIEALLARPGMSEAERAEALVLRAQAHVAFGDLDAAEEDYREILRMRPGYQPDASLTPSKAMERYRKVRSEMVGQLRVTLDPADSRLLVDGREVTPEVGGIVPILSGEHVIRAERAGHDPAQETVVVQAGKEQPLRLQLLPNARTVVLRTEPEGVEVLVDGVSMGLTARPDQGPGGGQGAAQIVLENVPLGEHSFELRKECYRTERLKDAVTIDLLDRSPKVYKPVELVPASSVLALAGGPSSAQVFVDGQAMGRLPVEPLSVCPGEREVEVRLAGRRLWRETVSLDEAVERRVEIRPRPNAALVGVAAWPRDLAEFGDRFSTLPDVAPPQGGDLSAPADWARVKLSDDTDLALAVVSAERGGAGDRWYLYSPTLRQVTRLDRAPEELQRPRWSRRLWGFQLVDSALAGTGFVVEVTPGSAAAEAGLQAGDRVTSVGGREVGGAAEVARTLAAAAPGRPIEIGWRTAGGEERAAEVTATNSPLLEIGPAELPTTFLRAAWAVVDALASPEDAPAALSNLALVFGSLGQHDVAVDTWRRVRWEQRAGIGDGTRQYYLGRELEALGREADAIEAYRKAAASDATVVDDAGPRVAPAARDRLADLGVSVSAP